MDYIEERQSMKMMLIMLIIPENLSLPIIYSNTIQINYIYAMYAVDKVYSIIPYSNIKDFIRKI